jgi:hypothetical protein
VSKNLSIRLKKSSETEATENTTREARNILQNDEKT